MIGVILYGPPAAGKDTITAALHQLDPAYTHFRRLKAGPGRTTGYRMTTPQHLSKLRQRGEVIWENRRYDSAYVVDRSTLVNLLTHAIPVVHLGQVEAITAVTEAIPDASWITAYLWCPRDVAEQRIIARNTGDAPARLQAWDETPPLPDADLAINTAETSPDAAAQEIHQRIAKRAQHCRIDPY